MKTKEELLKIYSAYLPYGLEFQLQYDRKEDFEWQDFAEDLSIFEKATKWKLCGYADSDLNIPLGDGEFSGFLWRNNFTYVCFHYGLKPILYSMDMITKEIEHNGEKIILLHKILESYCFDLSKMEEEEILSYAESLIEVDMSYSTAQILLEHHFNIFKLSEGEYIKKELL